VVQSSFNVLIQSLPEPQRAAACGDSFERFKAVDNSPKNGRANQAAEAMALRRLRDGGQLTAEAYAERLDSIQREKHPICILPAGSRLPGAAEILEKNRAARSEKKSA